MAALSCQERVVGGEVRAESLPSRNDCCRAATLTALFQDSFVQGSRLVLGNRRIDSERVGINAPGNIFDIGKALHL